MLGVRDINVCLSGWYKGRRGGVDILKICSIKNIKFLCLLHGLFQ
jgi:hypothetical protein